jgi:zinc protease
MELDRSRILATGSTGNLPNMLAHLSERVTSMNVDTGVLTYYRREVAATVEASDDLPVAKASRAVTASLFRGHSWGNVAIARDGKDLSAGDVESWYERAWSPDNAVLVVTGDLDAEATMLEVEKWLGPWSRASKPFAPAAPIAYRKGAVELISTTQPGSTQAQVHLACLADASTHSKSLANQILASVISTALFEKIRGELGASYGFGGGAELLVGGAGRLDWSGSIENARLPQALAVMAKVMKNFESDTLTDRALERARWSVAREATMGQATSPLTAEVFTQRVLAGHKTAELDTSLFDSLAAIGKAEVLDAWNRCHGHMALSLVGDEAGIAEATKGVEF